jgi:hypothetical protein
MDLQIHPLPFDPTGLRGGIDGWAAAGRAVVDKPRG